MPGTILTQSIIFFKNQHAAQALADRLTEDDADCTYTVEEYPKGFVVVVRDEDGFKLGTI